MKRRLLKIAILLLVLMSIAAALFLTKRADTGVQDAPGLIAMTIPIAERGVTATVPLQPWAGALLNETLEMSFKQSEKEKTDGKNTQECA